MIYLITGTPGTGKTAMVLSWIHKNTDGLFTFNIYERDDKGKIIKPEVLIDTVKRPLFVNHIDELDHDYFGSQDISDEEVQSGKIWDVLPTPTEADPNLVPPVLIVDEAHRLYPVRSASAKNPDYVESLAELRHHGVTLILITQHPTSIDKYVRDRVGKHVHITRAKVGTKAFSFYEVETNLSKANLKNGIEEFYSIDKAVWEHYKSASMHVKFKKKMLKIIWVFPLILIFGIALISYIVMNFGNLTDFTGRNKTTSETEQLIASDVKVPQNDTQTHARSNEKDANYATSASQPQTLGDDKYNAQMLTPRIPEQPWSKPIYDELRQAKNMEWPAAIIVSKGKCTAYSDQGTVLNVPDKFCRKWLKDGLYNPYKERQVQQQQTTQTDKQPSQSNSILSLTDSTKDDAMRPSIRLDAQ